VQTDPGARQGHRRNAGLLLTEVLYTKTTPSKEFVIVDAGMNDWSGQATMVPTTTSGAW